MRHHKRAFHTVFEKSWFHWGCMQEVFYELYWSLFILSKGTYYSQVGVLNGIVIPRLTCLPEKGRSPELRQLLPEALPWLGVGRLLCPLSWTLARLLQKRKLTLGAILRKVNRFLRKLPSLTQKPHAQVKFQGRVNCLSKPRCVTAVFLTYVLRRKKKWVFNGFH